ncbi:MAG: HAMP domain-containing protein [Geobacter sp.]|nr:HAMP domain-containing protein [Geobacter sp.]
MKLGITRRLFLAILAAAAIAVVSMFFIMHWSIDRGFLRYVNSLEQTRLALLAERLEESYSGKGSWDFLKENPAQWRRIVAESMPEEEASPGRRPPREEGVPSAKGGAGRPPMQLPPQLRRGFGQRAFLLDSERKQVVGPPEIPSSGELKPLLHRGQVVGYLGLMPRKRLSDERQLRFVKEQRVALALVGGVVLLLAAGLSLPLASRLVRPIRALAAATNRMAAGHFDTRVPVSSSDELGHLARDFNSMALALEKNEQTRRQWVADISHELRTPLAVLRGEIEAIQDGVRQPSPEAVQSLHGEVMRLSRLVDDLYQLSLSDAGALTYRKEELDLAEVLTEALDTFRNDFARKEIALQMDIPAELELTLFADHERLRQLFANLLENTLKYTDPGGALEVRLERLNGRVALHFQDTSPGVPVADLERLFDRLYRVESSRNRASGGAGLGLAICRNIVEAHEGTISALPSPLGGVWIRVELPLTEKMG